MLSALILVTFNMKRFIFIVAVLMACVSTGHSEENMNKSENLSRELKKATFAGGCFWCMEKPFEQHQGVVEVISGYTGGHKDNPEYKEVSSGSTGHLEAVQITYDPVQITYEKLLDIFWRQVNPTDSGGQFNDRGEQYRTAIFYQGEDQKKLAEASKRELTVSGRHDNLIVTEIIKASTFFKAEDYHQDYYKKSPLRYKTYRFLSGRDAFLEKTWKNK